MCIYSGAKHTSVSHQVLQLKNIKKPEFEVYLNYENNLFVSYSENKYLVNAKAQLSTLLYPLCCQ